MKKTITVFNTTDHTVSTQEVEIEDIRADKLATLKQEATTRITSALLEADLRYKTDRQKIIDAVDPSVVI